MIVQFKLGAILLIVGFVFNFIETWYFGWNLKAGSSSELICDYISQFLMLLGLLAVIGCFVRAV